MGGLVLACMMPVVCTLQTYESKQLEPCRIIKSLQSCNLSDTGLRDFLRDFLRDNGLEVTTLPLATIVINGLISSTILSLLVPLAIMLRFGRFMKKEP